MPELFSQNAPPNRFNRVLNKPLNVSTILFPLNRKVYREGSFIFFNALLKDLMDFVGRYSLRSNFILYFLPIRHDD